MKFQPDTVEDLRVKLAELEEQRASYKVDLDHFAERAATYRRLHDEANKRIADYTLLLGYADTGVPSVTAEPSVVRLLGRLTPAQRKGNACFICGKDITISEPDQHSAVVDGIQLFVHVDPAVCTRTLAARLTEEVPF